MRNFALCLTFLLILHITACQGSYEYHGVLLDDPKTVGEVIGVQHDNTQFRLSDQRGKFVLVNFGYTYCPDICPLTLSEMARFYRSLEQENASLADEIEVVFVTVDPERDLPARLNEYVSAFHDEFRGLYIGDEEQLNAVKSSFGVFSEKAAPSEGSEGYFVNHTGGIFVVNPDGEWVLFFPHDVQAEQILADVTHLLKS